MKVVILGGTGFIGSYITSILKENNFSVLPIGRSTKKSFQVGKIFNEEILDNIDVLLYLSWDFNTNKQDYHNINIESFNTVSKLCKKNKVKLIFFSTLFASELSESKYNNAKRACEKIAISDGFTVVRLGSVLLEANKLDNNSFYTNIYNFVDKFHVFPIIKPEKKIFRKTSDIHLEKFTKEFMHLKNQIYVFANEKNQTLQELLNFEKKKILLIPIHWKIIYLLLKTIELFYDNFVFRSDSILSIWGD